MKNGKENIKKNAGSAQSNKQQELIMRIEKKATAMAQRASLRINKRRQRENSIRLLTDNNYKIIHLN